MKRKPGKKKSQKRVWDQAVHFYFVKKTLVLCLDTNASTFVKSSQTVFSLWATNTSLISKERKKGHSDIKDSQWNHPSNCINSAKCFNEIIWRECQESLPLKKITFLLWSYETRLFHSSNTWWCRRSALGEPSLFSNGKKPSDVGGCSAKNRI